MFKFDKRAWFWEWGHGHAQLEDFVTKQQSTWKQSAQTKLRKSNDIYIYAIPYCKSPHRFHISTTNCLATTQCYSTRFPAIFVWWSIFNLCTDLSISGPLLISSTFSHTNQTLHSVNISPKNLATRPVRSPKYMKLWKSPQWQNTEFVSDACCLKRMLYLYSCVYNLHKWIDYLCYFTIFCKIIVNHHGNISSAKSITMWETTRCSPFLIFLPSAILISNATHHRAAMLGGFLPEASYGLRVLSLPASVCVCVCVCVYVCPSIISLSGR